MDDTKRYAKIVTTDDGGSKFEDAEVDLTAQKIVDGVPPMLVGSLSASAGAVYLRAAKFDSEPHPAPRKQWVVMIRGTIEVEVTNGEKQRFEPGDLVLVTDTAGKGHSTVAVGSPPFEALFIPA